MPSANEQRLQEFDWAQSPLGDRSGWPTEMVAAVNMMMASDFPMCTVWGAQRIQIYNDAYNPIYGAKHPASFGRPAHESWPEIWEFLGPALDEVVKTGTAVWFAETLLPLVRASSPEECYFDFSYSPIRSADGSITGLLSVAAERTSEVVARRRLRLAELDGAREVDETFDVLMRTLHEILSTNEMDCAAAVLYSVNAETGAPAGEIWTLRANRGVVRILRPLAARALRRGSIDSAETKLVGRAISIPIFSLNGDPNCSLVIVPNELVPTETSVLHFAEALSTRIHAALHAAELRQRQIGKMRDQIAEQELLYKFLFNNIHDGVAYCATSGVPTDDEIIIAVNPRLCQMLGYADGELVGMSRDALFFPEDGALQAALEIRGREHQFTGTLQFRGKDGLAVPVEVSSNLIEFHKGESIRPAAAVCLIVALAG